MHISIYEWHRMALYQYPICVFCVCAAAQSTPIAACSNTHYCSAIHMLTMMAFFLSLSNDWNGHQFNAMTIQYIDIFIIFFGMHIFLHIKIMKYKNSQYSKCEYANAWQTQINTRATKKPEWWTFACCLWMEKKFRLNLIPVFFLWKCAWPRLLTQKNGT